MRIVEGIGIGLIKLEEGFCFQLLDFGFDLKEEDDDGSNVCNSIVNDESVDDKFVNGCDLLSVS